MAEPAPGMTPATDTAIVTVRPLEGRRQREAFIRLPGRLMAGDPNWVEPLWLERRRFLSPRHNAFFGHAEAAFWLAWRGGRPVGRISAQIDRLAPPVDGMRLGYFGMLAAEPDAGTLGALFGAAEDWLAARGAGVVRGPFDLSINQTTGLLVDGFDTPPSLMMGHDPPWLGAEVERQGYARAKDLVAYRMDVRGGLPDKLRRLAERGAPGLTIRSIDMRRYRAEVATITDIFNDAWAGNWGFTPLTEAESAAMADEMKPILDPDLIRIAEIQGEPAGFIVLLPNVNEAIADLGGRLLPLGWLKLLWRIKAGRIRTARVPLMGVRKAHARTMLGKTLPLKLIYALESRGVGRGLGELELGWLLEDNWPVRHVVEGVGGWLAKTYRVYEKRLG
ncbi:MAG TPA: N-acetyltransferase [Thermohalobaculum sp.]|nr:N-acetyltransferase [Thermohalobaculum sp.]